ncbi:MAG: glycosyltransferase [Flavobacterium sp.]|nr:glycosyltransferase [Flavobacterium sp.]
MKNLLYIGNKLTSHGNTQTSIDTLGKFLENEGYTIYYASTKKNKIFRLLDMIFVTIKCRNKVNYVLIDTYSTQNFWYAFIISQLCRLLNLKYIPKLHGGNLPFRLKNNPFTSELIFKYAYKITAPSGYLFDAFSIKFSKNLLHIPNSIQVANYPFLKNRLQVPKLLWVRSFSKIYNPKMAIDVLVVLKNDFPDAELCMVGPDKENLIEDCKLYASTKNVKVNFTGKLSAEEWIAISSDYSVFINTTHFDNTPVSVIEAMALGMPVITTNVGGIPFLINDRKNGLLVNDEDYLSMANSIKELLTNNNLYDSVLTNARKTSEEFDWNIIKMKWFEILK